MASLRQKVETAFAAVISAAVTDTPVYTGFAATDKAGSCVIVAARRAEEEPAFSGNYRVTVDIHIKGPPDATGAFDDLALAVRTAVWKEELAAELSAAVPEFTVFGGSAPNVLEWSQSGDVLVETQTVEIYCAQALTEA